MTVGTLDPHAGLAAMSTRFRNAGTDDLDLDLDLLVGDHEGHFAGPLWLRGPAPALCAVTGMAGWCGKTFARSDDPDVLTGANLTRWRGRTRRSIPVRAWIAPEGLDGRPVLHVQYPAEAPYPWRRVFDELRPAGDGVLLGFAHGIPGTPAAGAPFVLRRTGTGAATA